MASKSRKNYLKGLQRADNNFDGQIGNGFGNLFSGGGLMNTLTGLGTFSRDKVMQASYIDGLRITDPELSALYHNNDLAKRIIEFRPKEMFRRGYEVVFPDPDGDEIGGQNGNAELALDCEKYAANIRADEMIKKGFIFGRMFGGTLVIIGADDGQDMSKPLNEDKIKSVKYLNLIDRRFLYAHTYYGNPLEPKFGEVETYQVTNAFGDQQQTIVHETRVLRFDGAEVEILKKRQLAGWTLSVLQAPYDTLRQFDTTFQAISNLVVDASQGVFKMQGLMEQIASGELSALQSRMAMVDMSRSSARSILLDADNEDFSRTTTSFAGLPDVVDRFMQRLASAAEMPVTILFGREPAGLNATGEADFEYFYNTVASDQKILLQPILIRLYTLIAKAKDSPCKGVVPEDGIEIIFHPLKEPNDVEKADIYSKMATADSAYVTAQILLPQEVALSRFRGSQFRLETEIDIDARKKSMEADLDFHVAAAELRSEQGPEQLREGTPEEPANPQQAPPGPTGSKSNPQTGRAP